MDLFGTTGADESLDQPVKKSSHRTAALDAPRGAIRKSALMREPAPPVVIVGNKQQIAATAEAALVDAYAAADRACKSAEDAKKNAREKLLAHFTTINRPVAKSASAFVQLAVTSRAALDTKLVRTEMGEAWCEARSKVSEVSTLKITWLE